MSDLPPPPSERRRAWLRPVLVVAVLAAVAIGAWLIWKPAAQDTGTPGSADAGKAGKSKAGAGKSGGRSGGGDPNRAQPVTVATARIGDINIIQTGLGTVTALRTVTVKPRVDGQLQSVAFTEGQIVKEGELIAQIDPIPFQVALSQAEGQLARDAATLNNARLDLDRYRTLLTQDSIASQQVDSQASLVKQLEGTVKIDQAMVDNAKLQLSYTRITAPVGGRIGLRLVDPGNQVHGSDANGLAVITQLAPIAVLFTIPQDTLPRIMARLKVGDKPPVEAWDREQKNLLASGVLMSVDNQIDVQTGTVKLKAQFANNDAKLFANQFVNVRMVVDTLKGAVLVPTAAVQRNTQGPIVYVVKDDSTVALRTVQTGPTEGPSTAIVSGLQAGERVITDGVDRIREGAKVEVTQPGGGARDPNAPNAGKARGDYKNMDPAKREEYKKRLEAMDPAQREEFRKRREAAKAGEGGAPAPATNPQ
ncbi:MAG: MdtA/MuxA family multidrug efflux RND transporter periplasmic adaptor subunit [Usitatibacter sp.]